MPGIGWNFLSTLSVHFCDKIEYTIFLIKWTFYLQKVEAPKVTLGVLFWILNEHSVQVWEKNYGVCFIYLWL